MNHPPHGAQVCPEPQGLMPQQPKNKVITQSNQNHTFAPITFLLLSASIQIKNLAEKNPIERVRNNNATQPLGQAREARTRSKNSNEAVIMA